MPALGWLLLALDALVLWIGLGYVRFRAREALARAAQSRRSEIGNLPDVGGPGAATAANDLSSGATPLGS